MDYKLADRVLALKPSAIREILKNATDPTVISLSAGNPAPEAFPAKELAEISARLLSENPVDALQYGVTEGFAPLREAVAARLKSQGMGTAGDDLLITSGAQQAIDLAAKSLCNEGDVVLCEAPSFIGALNAFRAYNARLRGIPMDSGGMDMDALETALREEPRAKLIYTIPNFQNPSGITMNWEKRQRLYALAKQYGVVVLEDNPYGDLRFEGTPIPAVKTLDEDGVVIYVGSFSKVVSPGMRVGYALAPKEILQKMVVCKQSQDVHSNAWAQRLCYEFITKYDFDSHLERLRDLYRKKCALAESSMERWLAPHGVTWNHAQGGLFLWCTLPKGVDMLAFCKEAASRKSCVVPGTAFLTDDTAPCGSFRVNFSTPTDEQLARGIEILGQTASDFIIN